MATKTATATPLQRADELLREMTLEEKAMQLSCFTSLALFGPDGPLRGRVASHEREERAFLSVATVSA